MRDYPWFDFDQIAFVPSATTSATPASANNDVFENALGDVREYY